MGRGAAFAVGIATVAWACDDSETSCFVAGTRIATPSGPRPIEALKPGDLVIAFDLAAQRTVARRVASVSRSRSREILRLEAAGRVLRVTRSHPFYETTRERFVRVDELDLRSFLLAEGPDGPHAVPITALAVEATKEEVEVFNLHVDGDEHNYFAEGILVHNKSPADDSDGVEPVGGTGGIIWAGGMGGAGATGGGGQGGAGGLPDLPFDCSELYPLAGPPPFTIGTDPMPEPAGGVLQTGTYVSVMAADFLVESPAGACMGAPPAPTVPFGVALELTATHFRLTQKGDGFELAYSGTWSVAGPTLLLATDCPSTGGRSFELGYTAEQGGLVLFAEGDGGVGSSGTCQRRIVFDMGSP